MSIRRVRGTQPHVFDVEDNPPHALDNGRFRDTPSRHHHSPETRPANQSFNGRSLRRFRDGNRDDQLMSTLAVNRQPIGISGHNAQQSSSHDDQRLHFGSGVLVLLGAHVHMHGSAGLVLYRPPD